jgi:hypothetical protein
MVKRKLSKSFFIIALFVFCLTQWQLAFAAANINGWIGAKVAPINMEPVGMEAARVESKGLGLSMVATPVAKQITKYADKINAEKVKVYKKGDYTYANFVIPVGSETHVFNSSGKRMDYSKSSFDKIRPKINNVFRKNKYHFTYMKSKPKTNPIVIAKPIKKSKPVIIQKPIIIPKQFSGTQGQSTVVTKQPSLVVGK